MDKKDFIVVIPGANYLRSKNSIFEGIILWFYRIFNVVPDYSLTKEKWIPKLERENREIKYFDWSGDFMPQNVEFAAQHLINIIKDKENVKIISCSLGTQVCLDILKDSTNIERIISVCGVYREIDSDINFIDIRSDRDLFGNFLKSVLNLFPFAKMKTKTVIVENMRHDEFHTDKIIKSGEFKEKRLSDVINSFLN